MDTPIVILNYKTYLESSGKKALDLAKDLESVASETGITMVSFHQVRIHMGVPHYLKHLELQ